MQKAWGYVRVSTVDQEAGFGPEVQEERIRKYCKEHGLPEPEIFRESKSGESIAPRNELHLMMARAEAFVEEDGRAYIIIYSLDRLTRDLIDQEAIVNRCFDRGVRIHSTLSAEDDTLDPSYAGDPMRTAIRQFFGLIHQLDRAIIHRRLEGGLARKAAGGGFTGGRVPFGYRAVDGELRIEPKEATVVRHLFELQAALGNQSAVAGILQSSHPGTGKWTSQRVSRILQARGRYEGKFSPRGSDQVFDRPDLRILGPSAATEATEAPPVPIALDWEALPDPVPLDVISLALNKDAEDLRRIVRSEGLLLRHIKRRDYLPRRDAARLRDICQK